MTRPGLLGTLTVLLVIMSGILAGSEESSEDFTGDWGHAVNGTVPATPDDWYCQYKCENYICPGKAACCILLQGRCWCALSCQCGATNQICRL